MKHFIDSRNSNGTGQKYSLRLMETMFCNPINCLSVHFAALPLLNSYMSASETCDLNLTFVLKYDHNFCLHSKIMHIAHSGYVFYGEYTFLFSDKNVKNEA